MERFQQIEEIFQEALQHDPAERDAYVRQACGEDAELQREVVSLLAHHDKGDPEAWAAAAAAGLIAASRSLQPGESLGPYRIESFLAAGGMGEVYRATDIRLNRQVAIKIASARFTERFEREAHATASLNHPHICQLYDVGPNYLVMELVDGAPLQGPLALKQAVEYAAQILDALDAAHRRGITHRDLKPANILVTKQGIKLLDFGLARQSGPLQETDATRTAALTSKGQIIGTLQYMSPEQLQGKEADGRSDLFSFGCVLYEMLAGQCAFHGQSAASVIAAILEREPAPLNLALPLERVVRKCLAKDPDHRFQTARDLNTALTWALEEPLAARANHRRWIAAAVAVVIIVAIGGWTALNLRHQGPDARVLRLQLDPPTGGQFFLGIGTRSSGGFALSPDGKNAAYVAFVNGKIGLWVRPLDGIAARLLPGTEDAGSPFWSPDNQSIAFVAGGRRLFRVDLQGGVPVPICDIPYSTLPEGSWDSDGYILFSTRVGIFRVSASGGTPSRVTAPDASGGELFYYWPQALPGGRFLFWIQGIKPEITGIYAASLARPAEHVKLLTVENHAVYAAESHAIYTTGVDGKGYLVWLRGVTLVAQEFNPATLEFAGALQPIAEGFNLSLQHPMYFAASANGLLLYNASGIITQFGWFDRTGKLLRKLGEPIEGFLGFRLSPDERQVAVQRGTAGFEDLWLMDAHSGVASRFTVSTAHSDHPVWSPDARTILFSQLGSKSMLRKASNGVGDEQVIIQRTNRPIPSDWSGDGRWVLTWENDPDTRGDLWKVAVTPDGKMQEGSEPTPYLRTPSHESNGRFSPEPSPRWVAFSSDETGQLEVYIDTFPEPHGKKRISTAGGSFPEWAAGGRELFYMSLDNKLMSVGLSLGAGAVEVSAPRELFQLHMFLIPAGSPYEVSRDGQRFLALTSPEAGPQSLTVIVNWPSLLKKGAAAP
jgi:predicted Ser/Thr protein kinase